MDPATAAHTVAPSLPGRVLIPQGNTDAISDHSVPLGYGELAINRPRILGREDGHWEQPCRYPMAFTVNGLDG